MEDFTVITLVKPLAGLTEVTLTEPTVDEISKLSDESQKFGAVRAMKNLIAKMTKSEPSVIGQMGARDFKACQKFLDSFFD